jgi:hypothetical protein
MNFLSPLFSEKVSPTTFLFLRVYHNVPIVCLESKARFYIEYEKEKEWNDTYDMYLHKIQKLTIRNNFLQMPKHSKSYQSLLSSHSNNEYSSFGKKIFNLPNMFSKDRSYSIDNIEIKNNIQKNHISIDDIIMGSIVFQIYNRCFSDQLCYPPLSIQIGISKHNSQLTEHILMKRKKLFKRIKKIYYDTDKILQWVGHTYIQRKDPSYLEAFIVLCIVRIFNPSNISIKDAFETVDRIPNISQYNISIAKNVLHKFISYNNIF